MAAKTKKILVVDDDRDIREIISLILQDEGYEVAALDNGREVNLGVGLFGGHTQCGRMFA
ncbi:hypothetical protein [Mucilaginibacter aquaedulcis]|uniref:hypothetical protein n=1 Tax=Mucilaginibacter aquaedulcis TaxID=1187081 RepID=UPI0025B52E77|nr:hypothetical protein [Mucilaginibacter aquaedulcis]MDN3550034.1 hypothetical protein [Mucilaginibacter aquaedulcis]